MNLHNILVKVRDRTNSEIDLTKKFEEIWEESEQFGIEMAKEYNNESEYEKSKYELISSRLNLVKIYFTMERIDHIKLLKLPKHLVDDILHREDDNAAQSLDRLLQLFPHAKIEYI